MTNELTRLGCTVVHAEPDKLVLFSNKKTIHEAIGYADFIEKRLVEKQYFQALDFKLPHAWSIVLWYSYLNHGGSRVIIEDGEVLDNEDEPELS